MSKSTNKPLIAISAGDPAGIGPEVCVKAISGGKLYKSCRPFVICDVAIILQIIEICGINLQVIVISNASEGIYKQGIINVFDIANIDTKKFTFGSVSQMNGKASFQYVLVAIKLALAGKADATVTGPINKEAIQLAGYNFSGHTEIFAHHTNTKKYAMMLADKSFRVIHVNTHRSMIESVKNITKDRVLEVIRLAHSALLQMGIIEPSIAVAGLNPHAGENGLFGDEEIKHIIPAIEAAKNEGINADGPHPPDTIFSKMKGGQYDIVVCMYHDQGHIPVKLLGFSYNHKYRSWGKVSGVNITLGLPIIRVSVDHGTAFDKGGKGTANPESMINAIKYATLLSKSKKNNDE